MITIFSKDYCPYCAAAKDLLKSLGAKFSEIDITNDDEKMIEISRISGMRTVPQIYVGEITKENCLGGYSDIAKLHEEGKLIEKIKQ
nr:glutaredoxin domain-containing protein [Candidatus Gracilibacteria bacterium]